MRVCASCGESNPERARFCLACATPLASPARRHGEERKLVSVLFCDLVGFTARSDRADPEDVRAVLRPYHARLRVELERFGGTVEKFVGDAVMAVFGAPTAYEDDAERAVRAALRILEAIDELNAAEPTLALTVRVGLTTGQVLVALGARPEQGEGIVTGDVVNTAARLQTVAPAGGVVVDETTWRLTRQLVIYEELAPVTVKGKDEPVPVWRATGARNRTGTVRPVTTPFVARQDELSMLKAAWRRALREPSVQLVTVVGEPGVGKSRLVRELFVALDAEPQPVAWRQGSCLPYGEGITFWALGEVVKAEAGILESDGPTAAAAKLAAAVEAVEDDPAEREWLKARLAPLIGLGDADRPETAQRTESFAAWGRFLEDVAGRSPLVLVIEDLHWADQALLEFLVHLLEWTTSVPLLLVATARPELHERVAGWGGGVRNATTIALGPLSDADTARLLSMLLGRSVMLADTQAILLERAGGNPLYAEEFVRLLADRGLLTPDGDGPGVAEVPAPETVQALIAARLDTLSVERKALLQDAAVVGRVFWSGALAAMGGIDEPEVRQDLHELARKELVRPARRSSVAGQGEYAFWHLLVRDTAYEQIPRAARAGKHRSAAAWIERLAGERVADHAELLAHHYGQALFLARAARLPGAQLAELEQPARRFLTMAGDRTVNLDVARAEAYYLKALDLCPSGHAARAAVLVKAAAAAIQTGRLEVAESQLQAAIAASGDREDAVIRGDALLVLAGLLWNQGKTGAGRAALLEAIELLEREQPGRRLASAYAGMAANRLHAGRAQEALAWADRTLGLAGDLGVVELKVRGLRLRGVARCDLGDLGGWRTCERRWSWPLGTGWGSTPPPPPTTSPSRCGWRRVR
jgi:class 3 adenylate cyclase/tetratricopeptide (TPR) repeat protein